MFHLFDQKGAALIVTLLVMMVLTILGGGIIVSLGAEVKQTATHNNRIQAYYYAKSGSETVKALFETDLLKLVDETPFYLYGSIDGLVKESGLYTSTDHDDKEILVKITKPSTNTINITSTGRNQSGVAKVQFEFAYTLSSGTNKAIPPTGDDANNAGPGDGNLDWHRDNGRIQPGAGAKTSEKPVVFDIQQVIEKFENSGQSFKAPAMYFMNEPDSILLKFPLTLISDFISFYGNIDGKGQGAHNGDLMIYINNSTIDGSQITGGIPGTSYGIVYIGGTTKHGNTILTLDTPSYYYFPNGTNLTRQSSNGGLYGVDDLIKINDLATVDFSKLGVSINNGSATISPGVYQ